MTTQQITDALAGYGSACDKLAHTFETVLMRDYDDDEEVYTPSGRWIGGEAGGLYDFADLTANTGDMATVLEAVQEGRLEPREAFRIYSEWWEWMTRAAELRSYVPGFCDRHVRYINLRSWLTGFPTGEFIGAVREAESRMQRYEAAVKDMMKRYGSETELGFPRQFTEHKPKKTL